MNKTQQRSTTSQKTLLFILIVLQVLSILAICWLYISHYWLVDKQSTNAQSNLDMITMNERQIKNLQTCLNNQDFECTAGKYYSTE